RCRVGRFFLPPRDSWGPTAWIDTKVLVDILRKQTHSRTTASATVKRNSMDSELGRVVDALPAVRDSIPAMIAARTAAILDSPLDCIVTIDHEGHITEFNAAAERTFGHRRDEVIGKQLADVIIPESLREQHHRGFARYLASGEAKVLGRRIEMTAVRA